MSYFLSQLANALTLTSNLHTLFSLKQPFVFIIILSVKRREENETSSQNEIEVKTK